MVLLHVHLLGEVIVEQLDPTPERLEVRVDKNFENVLELELYLLDNKGVCGGQIQVSGLDVHCVTYIILCNGSKKIKR